MYFENLQHSTVSPQDLRHAIEGRITTYYYVVQANLRQAQSLYSYQVEAGDWRIFFQLVPKTETVTAAEVRDAADKYLHHFSFVLLGPEGQGVEPEHMAHRDIYHFE